jgi:Leucine-rich repeat (LRR) protein
MEPQIDGQVGGLAVIRHLQKLERLVLVVTLHDIDFLKDAPQLTGLELYGLDRISEFGPLVEQGRLQSLSLSNCQSLTDLESLPPLGGLTDLHLRRSQLTCGLPDLISAAPKLRTLDLQFSDWVDSLTSLSSLALSQLTLWGCRNVTDLRPIANQKGIMYLDLEGTGISDLSALCGLQRLDTLWLRDCSQVRDIEPLRNLLRLRLLHLEGVAPGIDLAPLGENQRLSVHINRDQDVRNRDMLNGRLELGE